MAEMLKKIKPPHVTPALEFVGGSTFGRSPKISASRTYNLIVADGWLTDSYGYVQVGQTGLNAGRGIFTSIKGEFLLGVIGNTVYKMTPISNPNIKFNPIFFQKVGEIGSSSGPVFIAGNDSSQIAICDQSKLYIYNYATNVFVEAVLPTGVIPGYVTFKNGSFIIVDSLSSAWYLSQPGDGLNWFWGPSSTPVQGAIQTKPDVGIAVVSIPGGGNNIFLIGKTVTELWSNVPSTTFPYQRSTSSNIDYGCTSAATIATLGDITAWLSYNEKSGPVISVSTGASVQQISTDGYDFEFEKIKYPELSCAFFIRITGHLLYQLTFYHPDDNFSLVYDFKTKMFFDATDENLNYHILRNVAYFNGNYYGISLNDGGIYQLDQSTYVYDYGERGTFEKPRVRICPAINFRAPNNFRFAVTRVTFTMEEGNDPNNIIPSLDYQPRIELAVSKDGGYDFSYYGSQALHRLGRRQNIVRFSQLGSGNEFVFQFRFITKGPVNAGEGICDIWQ